MDQKLIERLGDSETALVCNAIDALGLSKPHEYYFDLSIQCLSPQLPALVGEAITIKLDSSSPGGEHDIDAYWRMLEEIDASSVPRVVVVQTVGADPRRECVAGDGMAKTLVSVGAAGLVTDGGLRDIPGIVAQGFKVFGLGPVVQHCALRWSGLNEPLTLGGVEVRSGDLFHGDHGGCIVVPAENHTYIAEACTLVQDFEKKAHDVLRQSGIPLREKRELVKRFSDELHADIARMREPGKA